MDKQISKKAKKLLEGVKFKELPNYGDLMTLKEFIENCESGGFIDYDGSGKYAFKDEMSDIAVYPSTVTDGNIDRDFTHVVWFNK